MNFVRFIIYALQKKSKNKGKDLFLITIESIYVYEKNCLLTRSIN